MDKSFSSVLRAYQIRECRLNPQSISRPWQEELSQGLVLPMGFLTAQPTPVRPNSAA